MKRSSSGVTLRGRRDPTITAIRHLMPTLIVLLSITVAKRADGALIVEKSDIDYPDNSNDILLANNKVKTQRDDVSDSCDSDVYCRGPLLDAVQMSEIFKDSKTFVDMKMKLPPSETLAKFEEFQAKHSYNASKEDLVAFVKDTFEEPGHEFDVWQPSDWTENPKFLERIVDTKMKQFASDLNKVWLQLGRKMKTEVKLHENLYSIVYLDHPVIVPGGRFREVYYWDSYWIMRGLLLSEMFTTTRGMLENFVAIINRFGFIPNGGRIYYSQRSQPPFFPLMVKLYVTMAQDNSFALNNVDTLAKEFQHFYRYYGVEVQGQKLFRYGYPSNGPRPESYREDVETARNSADRQEMYAELKAGAESGMDFSSRWFINSGGTNNGSLLHLNCRSIVPVELNALLHWNAKFISDLYRIKGDLTTSLQYEKYASDLQSAIKEVLWNEEVGMWLDYDLINKKSREYFTPTNLSPLWLETFDESTRPTLVDKVLKYIDRMGLDMFPGGVPNTLNPANEQWDYPNVWPPMQHMLIEGLRNLRDPKTDEVALRWATRWVQSNHQGWVEHKAMYEKYSCEEPGSHGGGGEYEVQVGFGWSNGVVLDLLNTYGDKITAGATKV